jgi:hypothetical protein
MKSDRFARYPYTIYYILIELFLVILFNTFLLCILYNNYQIFPYILIYLYIYNVKIYA